MRVAFVLAVLLALGSGAWLWNSGARTAAREATEGLTSVVEPPELLVAPSVLGSDTYSEPAPRAPAASVRASDSRTEPTLHARRGTLVVHGRVLDEDGAPLEDDRPAIGLVDARGEARELAADGRGVFSFSGLGSGAWSLRVDAVGFRTHLEAFILDETTSPLAREIRLERLSRLVVRAVTPAGEPLVQAMRDEPGFGLLRFELAARAVLEPSSAPTPTPEAAFSWSLARHCAESPSSLCLANRLPLSSFWPAVGSAARDLGPDAVGRLDLEREPPLFVELLRGTQILARERIEPGMREVRFEVEPASLQAQAAALTLRVLGVGSGQPLAGTVTLRRPAADALEFPLDAQGRLAVNGLPAGPQVLRVFAEGHEILRRSVTLPAGDALDLGELFLAPAVELRVEVADTRGRPFAGRFALAPLEPPGPYLAEELVSSVEGRLAFDGLRAGRYLLRTTDEGADSDFEGVRWALAPTEVRVSRVGTEPSRLQLEPAAELLLLGTSALPLRAYVRVSTGGHDLFEAILVPGWLPRFVLAPGPHRIEVRAPDGSPLAMHELVLRPGENEYTLAF